MVYRPIFRKQLDGTECQGRNCGCASAAMAAQRHRLGADPHNHHGWPPKPKEIRDRIQATLEAGCHGTSMNQNDAAVQHLYLVNLDVRYNVPWASFRSMISSGRGAIVCMKYSVFSPTKFDACPGFYGNHALYVNERRSSDGAFLVYDPLADARKPGVRMAPDWVPAELLKRACGAYPSAHYGVVHAAFTRDTEP